MPRRWIIAAALAGSVATLAGAQPPAPGQARLRLAPSIVSAPFLAPASALQAQAPATSLDLSPAPAVGATTGPVVTLDDLVATSLDSHPLVRAATSDLDATRGRWAQARLYPNPVVAVGSPQLAGDVSQYNAFVTQQVVTGNKLLRDSDVVAWEFRTAQHRLASARFQVLTEIRTRYYACLVLQQRTALLERLADILARSAEVGQRLLQAGEGARGDLLLLEVDRERARAEAINSRTLLEVELQRLAAACGTPARELGLLAGDLELKLPPPDLRNLQSVVPAVNATAAAARTDIGRSRAVLSRAVVEPIPDLELQGGYQYSVEPLRNQGLFQIAVTAPLFDRNQGAIRAASSGVCAATARARSVEVDLAAETAIVVGRLRTATEMVDRFRVEILPRARENFDVTQRLYAQGEIDFLRLLQAQRGFAEANLTYLEMQNARWAAAAQLAGLLQSETFP